MPTMSIHSDKIFNNKIAKNQDSRSFPINQYKPSSLQHNKLFLIIYRRDVRILQYMTITSF